MTYKKYQHVIGMIRDKSTRRSEKLSKDIMSEKYEEKVGIWQSQVDSILHSEFGRDTQFIKSINIARWKQMKLPMAWEMAGLTSYDGLVWFVKDIAIPASWLNKDLVLKLGMIDDIDVTYVNNHRVGSYKQFNQERVYHLPASIVGRKMRIAVKVLDAGGGGGFISGPGKMCLLHGTDSMSLAGTWNYIADFSYQNIPDRPSKIVLQHIPTSLYNAMIYPLQSFPVKGVVWYQGETNSGNPYKFRGLLKTMINDWNASWKNDLNFVVIQLPRYNADFWAEVREAQYMSAQLPNTDVVCTIDLNTDSSRLMRLDRKSIGMRVANVALKKTYRINTAYSGPRMKSYHVSGNKVEIVFETFGKKLMVKGEKIKGFEISGAGYKFVEAQAQLQGNNVVVWSDNIHMPEAVRYAWKSNPDCNLFSSDTLPVFPFRTDKHDEMNIERDHLVELLEDILQ